VHAFELRKNYDSKRGAPAAAAAAVRLSKQAHKSITVASNLLNNAIDAAHTAANRFLPRAAPYIIITTYPYTAGSRRC
jgi:ribosomal protein L16/L10AE